MKTHSRPDLAERNRTHGLSHTRTYRLWANMLTRCTNSKRAGYPRYGGRGIKVCDRWRQFAAFLDDMGHPPTALHSLDRVNNDGNYEPGNCRWATRREQNQNNSVNVWIELNGERRVLSEWCRHFGLSISTVKTRIKSGQNWNQAFGLEFFVRNRR
jgi:hypothetical protein